MTAVQGYTLESVIGSGGNGTVYRASDPTHPDRSLAVKRVPLVSEPGTVVRLMGPGQFAAENRHAAHTACDIVAALDDLQSTCPNLERVALVVAWFGSDLRADHFSVAPKVDSAIKRTFPPSWSVAGLSRATAPVVSTV